MRIMVLSFIVASICLFPNWDLVALANREGIDSLGPYGGRGDIVLIGIGAAILFALNFVFFVYSYLRYRRSGQDFYG